MIPASRLRATRRAPPTSPITVEFPDAPDTAVARLRALLERARSGGGVERQEKHRADGTRMTARERVTYLADPESFVETDALLAPAQSPRQLPVRSAPGDAVVTGFARVDQREVAVFAQDFTVAGGSLGAATAGKIVRVLDQAAATGTPVVALCDSGGARIQEGVASLGGYGEIFRRNVRLSGVVPQISVIMGPCAGGAVYSPALTDFTIMVRGTSHMFVTGPDVVKQVTGETTTLEDLGGADAQAASGAAHFVAANERDALDLVHELLSYLPANNREEAPLVPPRHAQDADPGASVPADSQRPYDARDVIRAIVDDGKLLEVSEAYAPNLVTAFARLDGRTVGVVANQPKHLAGVLDRDASEKGARFIRFCDAFHIPLVNLVDVPGYLPGVEEERGNIIHRGATILYAYTEATVPKLTVITRKAYGGAYIVMSSKHIGGDVNLAWPAAEIAVLGAQSAVSILHRRDLANADDPTEMREKLQGDYRERFSNPYQAAELGFVDAVIEPKDTRAHLIRHLQRLRGKHVDAPARKHGNMPL